MKEMREHADQYYRTHRTETVSNVRSYMFQVTTNPKKDNEKPKTVVYMASWFLEI